MIQILVKNVGIITEADIRLKGVTVLAGHNGTGKSTISKSVFAALNATKNIIQKIFTDQKGEIEREIEDWLESDCCEGKEDFLNEFIADDIVSQIFPMAEKKNEDVRLRVEDIHEIEKIVIGECVANNVKINDIDSLLTKITRIFSRDFQSYQEFFVDKYYNEVFANQINNLITDSIATIQYRKESRADNKSTKNIKSSVEIVDNRLHLKNTIPMQQENAIYIGTKSVLDAQNGFYRRNRIRRLPNVQLPDQELFAALRQENDLSYIESKDVEYAKQMIEDMLHNVTKGQLQIDPNGVWEFVDNDLQRKIEIPNMSSGLKVLAVIQRLVSNYALKKGDVLIFDEPEVNLHPHWQVILADVMVHIHKDLGIYIMVNSHSPYFIRALEKKLAENEIAMDGSFYFMQADQNGYLAKDVTDNKEIIYEALYQPLEEM